MKPTSASGHPVRIHRCANDSKPAGRKQPSQARVVSKPGLNLGGGVQVHTQSTQCTSTWSTSSSSSTSSSPNHGQTTFHISNPAPQAAAQASPVGSSSVSSGSTQVVPSQQATPANPQQAAAVAPGNPPGLTPASKGRIFATMLLTGGKDAMFTGAQQLVSSLVRAGAIAGAQAGHALPVAIAAGATVGYQGMRLGGRATQLMSQAFGQIPCLARFQLNPSIAWVPGAILGAGAPLAVAWYAATQLAEDESAQMIALATLFSASAGRMLGQPVRDRLNRTFGPGIVGTLAPVDQHGNKLEGAARTSYERCRLFVGNLIYLGLTYATYEHVKAALAAPFTGPRDEFAETMAAVVAVSQATVMLEAADGFLGPIYHMAASFLTLSEVGYEPADFHQVCENVGGFVACWTDKKKQALAQISDLDGLRDQVANIRQKNHLEQLALRQEDEAAMRVFGGTWPEVLLLLAAAYPHDEKAVFAFTSLAVLMNGLTEMRAKFVELGRVDDAKVIAQKLRETNEEVGAMLLHANQHPIAAQPGPANAAQVGGIPAAGSTAPVSVVSVTLVNQSGLTQSIGPAANQRPDLSP